MNPCSYFTARQRSASASSGEDFLPADASARRYIDRTASGRPRCAARSPATSLGREQRLIIFRHQAQRPSDVDQMRDLALDRKMLDIDPGSGGEHLRDVTQVKRGRDPVQLHIGRSETGLPGQYAPQC